MAIGQPSRAATTTKLGGPKAFTCQTPDNRGDATTDSTLPKNVAFCVTIRSVIKSLFGLNFSSSPACYCCTGGSCVMNNWLNKLKRTSHVLDHLPAALSPQEIAATQRDVDTTVTLNATSEAGQTSRNDEQPRSRRLETLPPEI